MRAPRAWALLFWCLVLLWASPHSAHAQIYRCVGTHGEPVFSGQPCGTPAPLPGAAGAVGSGFGDHCATSPELLRQAIAQAFATHDVNRLAGFIVWRGIDQASARAELQQLRAWLQQPLTGITTTHAGGAPPTGPGTEPAPPGSTAPVPVSLIVATAGSDAPRTFGLSPQDGCWWLTF